MSRMEIKICGLTCATEAMACADAGADAIGLVFHPPSPRYVDPFAARYIVDALPATVTAVGVFVDLPAERVAAVADAAGVRVVQLHGVETPETVAALRADGFRVIKALRSNAPDALRSEAERFAGADAWLVEGSRGIWPGGNGRGWDWSVAVTLNRLGRAFALAGGLSPANIEAALQAAHPTAVDISSGVEYAPGKKNIEQVAALVRAVRAWSPMIGDAGPVFRILSAEPNA